MKKIYLFLLVLCSICAFTACSDDEENDTPLCPVSDYSVPASVTAGNILTISGTGYVASAKIVLKNSQDQETATEDLQLVTGGITVAIPANLAAGSYKVILKQNGDWELGTITVAANPIEDCVIPANATAGENIDIAGKGFNENTMLYLENDELTADELKISNVTENGLTLKIPVILPGGNYRVMLDQGDGIKLGNITITAKSTPCVVSSIVKEQEWGNDSILFYYSNGKISSINFKSYEDQIYNIDYKSENSITADYVPQNFGYPITWKYTLTNGQVTTASMETKEMQYNDNGEELGVTNKTFQYTYRYTPENYLEQINQEPDAGGYDTLFFQYNSGQIQELTLSMSSPVMPEDPEEEIMLTSNEPTIETWYDLYTFNYTQQINNMATFDVMSVIMYKIDGKDNERLIRLLGISGNHPAQLPTSYISNEWEQRITYTKVNGYVTKIVFPGDSPEYSETFRIEYQ